MHGHADDMFEHIPERRRYIRSRADLEFQLARITLALSRAPIARRPETLAWFEEAADGLIRRACEENREYAEERVASIRDTFFPEAGSGARMRPSAGHAWSPGTRLQ